MENETRRGDGRGDRRRSDSALLMATWGCHAAFFRSVGSVDRPGQKVEDRARGTRSVSLSLSLFFLSFFVGVSRVFTSDVLASTTWKLVRKSFTAGRAAYRTFAAQIVYRSLCYIFHVILAGETNNSGNRK